MGYPRRTIAVGIRFSPALLKRIKREAEAHGQNIGETVRHGMKIYYEAGLAKLGNPKKSAPSEAIVEN